MHASTDTRKLEAPRQGMRGFWICGAASVGLAIAISPWDRVLSAPRNLQSIPGDIERIVSLSEIFAHGYGVGIIAIGIWLLVSSKRRFIPRIVTCAFWPAILVQLVKSSFGRYRPVQYLDEISQANYPANINDTWLGWLPNNQLNLDYVAQSFPSAHTATAWGLAIGMTWAFPKGKWLFYAIAVLASIQRVSSFAHWPSDVFFGVAIAMMGAGAITQNWGLGYYLGRFEQSHSGTPSIIESNRCQTDRTPEKQAA